MRKIKFILLGSLLVLSACQNGGSSSSAPIGPTNGSINSTDIWKSNYVGQEGHGGDAIVCFNIPIDQALQKIDLTPKDTCTTPPCVVTNKPNPSDTNPPSEIFWMLTAKGRKSIATAKPLEQYLAERINGKKGLLDKLNSESIQDGYHRILYAFNYLPAPAEQIMKIHQKLGWLHEDGIANEFGLRDVNDSGFVNETEIDQAHCKELQAVIRKDNQLWYDPDIYAKFDNAGKVLIQLHEEIYAWGKQKDEAIQFNDPVHKTSVKTRQLILKIMVEEFTTDFINQSLKDMGFSTLYWENTFNIPTAVGYYMDSYQCRDEQIYLEKYFSQISTTENIGYRAQELFATRYLKSSYREPILDLQNNFPTALANMINLVFTNSHVSREDFFKLLTIFKNPPSCGGGW